ncbi:unnamed protein product [Heterobilharzia americana]|nr:unnamed protein product [Heterobilharzia americana]
MFDKDAKSSLRALSLLLEQCGKDDLHFVFDQAHVSLRSLLFRENLRNDEIESIYKLYRQLFNVSIGFDKSRTSVEFLDDMSSTLFLVTTKNPGRNLWDSLSEECSLAIILSLNSFFSSIKHNDLISVFAPDNLPTISHICSFLLNLSEHSKNRDICLNSLYTLSLIAVPMDNICGAGDSSALFINSMKSLLPGFSHTFHRIITGDDRRSSSVKEAAFNAWSSILTSVFKKECSCDADLQKRKLPRESEAESSEWIATTVSHITTLVSGTIESTIHIHLELDINENVRLSTAFARWLGVLLLKCQALTNHEKGQRLRYNVVSGLLTLASQSSLRSSVLDQSFEKEGNCLARSLLAEFNALYDNKMNSITVPKSLSNLFGHELIRKVAFDSLTEQTNFLMNHLFSLLDETQLQKRFRTILGHLIVLDPEDVRTFVYSSEFFHRFCSALAKFLTFNLSSVELHEQSYLLPVNYYYDSSSCTQASEIQPSNLFRKSFQHFRDHSTLMLLQAIAGKLTSQRETVDLFLDTCRDIMDESDHSLRNSCLLLILGGIAGYINNDKISRSERKHVILSLLSLYFDPDILNLPTRQFEDVDTSSINDNDNNCEDYSTSLLQISTKFPSLDNDQPCMMNTYKSWPIEKSSNENFLTSTTNQLKDIKMNSLTICLLLEMFCTVSQMNTLPVNNDTSQSVEDQHFTECLRIDQVAKNCKYSSISELITDNADYLVSNITLDLHRVSMLTLSNSLNQSTPSSLSNEAEQSVLSACNAINTLFEYSTIDVLPILKPMVTQMLSSLDLTYEYTTELFLSPFYQLMHTCCKWNLLLAGKCLQQTDDTSLEDKSNTTSHAINNSSEYNKSLLSNIYQKTLRRISKTRSLHHIEPIQPIHQDADDSEGDQSCVDDLKQTGKQSGDHIEEDMDENKSRTFPDHLQIVEEVMLRCIHLMADGNPKLRILSMSVLKEGCLAMQYENDLLLPTVHHIWGSLMKRFRDRHAIVVEKAFELLTVLSKVAGNFIRSRASSEIIPPLVMFLTQGASVSASASKSYKYLTSYRVQKRLLKELGPLCREIRLSSKSLQSVINVLVIYLDDSQPEGLQQVSFSSIETMWSLDAGSTWAVLISHLTDLELQSLYCQKLVKPFEMIHIPYRHHNSSVARKGKNLKLKNISVLLNRLHGICAE